LKLPREIAPVTCRDFAAFLLDYVEGELPADTRRRFDAHLALCPDCVHYLHHYTGTIEASRTAMADELPADVPDDLVRAILQARVDAGDPS
jgi:anti-sigma factor RsiW